MLKILVILAMFIANPLLAEDPTPEVPAVEVTEEPTEETETETPVISNQKFGPFNVIVCTDLSHDDCYRLICGSDGCHAPGTGPKKPAKSGGKNIQPVFTTDDPEPVHIFDDECVWFSQG